MPPPHRRRRVRRSVARLETPDGASLELVTYALAAPPECGIAPPLLFVHGSLHASWCWEAHFLRFFAERGYPSHAVSLRGHGNSRLPPSSSSVVRCGGALSEGPRVSDLAGDIETALRAIIGAETDAASSAAVAAGGSGGDGAPVLVAHSFGGLPAQMVAMRQRQRLARVRGGDRADEDASSPPAPPPPPPRIAGLVLLSSMLPSDVTPLVLRTVLRRGVCQALRITRCFARRSVLTSDADMRWLFFSDALDETLVQRYRAACASSASPVTPRIAGMRLPRAPAGDGDDDALPVLVLGGDRDRLVDAPALRRAAAFWRRASGDGTTATLSSLVLLQGHPHDVMLDVQWRAAARELLQWLSTHAPPHGSAGTAAARQT